MRSFHRGDELGEVADAGRPGCRLQVGRAKQTTIKAKKTNMHKKPCRKLKLLAIKKGQSKLNWLLLHHMVLILGLLTSAGEKDFNSSPPCHAIFKYLILSLIGLLTVKYQSKAENPFDTHPLIMWVFFITTCCYCLALVFMKEMQAHRAKHSRIFNCVLPILGSLASVSLVSVFLPRLFGSLIFILWVLLLIIILARNLLKQLGNWLRLRIEKAVTQVLAKFNSCRNATRQSSHLCLGVGKAVDQVRDIFNNWWNATEQSSPHISRLPV